MNEKNIKQIENRTKEIKKSNPFVYKIEKSENREIKRDGLNSMHISAYAVGHLSNDLCAAAWFTYVLYYIKEVVGLSAT